MINRVEALRLLSGELEYHNDVLRATNTPLLSGGKNPAIVFSVAGSGKTQHLLDFLSETWGYYLVSGRVNHDEAASQSLLGARQGLGSSDTRHLCEVLDGIESPGKDAQFTLWERLLDNRWATCCRFRRKEYWSDNEPENRRYWFDNERETRRDWVLFQTICTIDFDPFLRTFEIALLMSSQSIRQSTRSSPAELMFSCLDEAQCELTVEQQNSTKVESLDNILPLLRGRRFGNSLIAAGTSLQLETFKDLLERNKDKNLSTFPAHIRQRLAEVRVFGNFKVVASDKHFL